MVDSTLIWAFLRNEVCTKYVCTSCLPRYLLTQVGTYAIWFRLGNYYYKLLLVNPTKIIVFHFIWIPSSFLHVRSTPFCTSPPTQPTSQAGTGLRACVLIKLLNLKGYIIRLTKDFGIQKIAYVPFALLVFELPLKVAVKPGQGLITISLPGEP